MKKLPYQRVTDRAHHPRHVADFSTIPELIQHAKDVDGATHMRIKGRQLTLYFPLPDGRYQEAVAWHEHGYWHAPAADARKVIDKLPAGAESIGSHTQRVSRRLGEDRADFNWREVWFADPADGEAFVRAIQRVHREIVADLIGHVVTTNATPQDIQRVISRGRWRDEITTYPERRRAAEAREHTVRDYIAVDHRGAPIAGPFTDYGQAKREAAKAGGYVKFASGSMPRVGEARRRPATQRGSGKEAVMRLATALANKVGDSPPTYIEGGHRWSDSNESAQFRTRSPEYNQPVVVLVSIFDDGSASLDFFSSETRSETDRYESIGHFLYGPGGFTSKRIDEREMVRDIQWVWKTVDGYAASWQNEGETTDEHRRGARKPVAPMNRHAPSRPPHRRAGPVGHRRPAMSSRKRDRRTR